MVTTTVPPAPAKLPPSYIPSLPEPETYAPPWTHTITGSPEPARSGVQTFRLRHSLSLHVRGLRPGGGGTSGFCGAAGPGTVPSRTPVQPAAGMGGRNRRAPAGEPA